MDEKEAENKKNALFDFDDYEIKLIDYQKGYLIFLNHRWRSSTDCSTTLRFLQKTGVHLLCAGINYKQYFYLYILALVTYLFSI